MNSPPVGPVGTSSPVEIGPVRRRHEPGDPLEAVWIALEGVCDPELCLDVVSLGLVYDVRDEDGTVVVEMTLTTPGCPVSESLPEAARQVAEEAVGSSLPVEVRLVWEPPWSPAMMDEEAAEALGFRVR